MSQREKLYLQKLQLQIRLIRPRGKLRAFRPRYDTLDLRNPSHFEPEGDYDYFERHGGLGGGRRRRYMGEEFLEEGRSRW
ncbi:hypothetical protein Avbf_03081 [Armadillidium vulgare]|nr:hypothetical protein Avbf_03081 [Armadillidium vulgare]